MTVSPSPRSGTAHTDTFVRDNLPPEVLQPEFLLDLPLLRLPERLNCAAELIDRAVGPHGYEDRLAVLSPGGVRWSYADLNVAVSRIAHVLTDDMGLLPGNRVLLRGANSPMLAAAWLAVIKAGGVAVTTMPLLRAGELRYAIDKAKITHVLCESALLEEMAAAVEAAGRELPTCCFLGDVGTGLEAAMAAKPDRFAAVDTEATDPCLIGFTSGTTGSPKATVHSHRDVMAICNSFPYHVLKAHAEDRFVGSPSLAFTFGLGGLLLFPLHAGATTVLLDQASPRELACAISEFKATICFSGPTAYRMICVDGVQHDLSSLRECVSAGEALPPGTRRLWKQHTGNDLIDGLGSTEMLHIFISMRGQEAVSRPGAIGRAVPGYQVAVLGEDGSPLPSGEVGRLAVKGPTGCRYLDDERQRDYVHDGWNLTGDACWADEDGYLYYHARVDDMIVSAGYNISPVEVEDALLACPGVAECAVVAAPDDVRGAVVKAYVVPAAGYAPTPELAAELQEFVKNTIAPYKYPRTVEFRSRLPRAETGKVQRFRLREASGADEPKGVSRAGAVSGN